MSIVLEANAWMQIKSLPAKVLMLILILFYPFVSKILLHRGPSSVLGILDR
jgi:hypothetical protein